MMSQKERLLRDIGIVDFTLTELVLYLDTHPTDCSAIEHFNHYNKMKIQMEKEFAQKYYPLNTRYAESGKEWSWGMAPNPWEGGCA